MEKIAYNVQEAAAALGLCADAVYDLAHRPDFPAVRVGNRILIPCESLARPGAPGRCARPGGLYLRRVYSPAAGAGGCGGPVRGARKFTSACEFAQKREAAGAANTERPKEKS